jgi:lipoprotein NlpI
MARYYLQPSSDFFIVQQVNNEKNRTLKARMLFYLAVQYKLQGKVNSARTYLLEASDARTSGFIENRLATWELRMLPKDSVGR